MDRQTPGTRGTTMEVAKNQKDTDTQEVCGNPADDIPIGNLRMEDDLTPVEEDRLLDSGEEHQQGGPVKRLSRGALRKKRIEEALARGEKILSRKERREAWEAKNSKQAKPTSDAGTSGTQAAGMAPVQGKTSQVTPDAIIRPSTSGVKRLRSQLTPEEPGAMKKKKTGQGSVGTKRPAETFAEKASVEKLAIVSFEHPGAKLTEDQASKIKGELGRRAFRGKDVRMSSCHLECGAVVVGCVNASTKEWLEKQIQELGPVIGAQLKLGPARVLVKMTKVSTFVPKTVGARGKQDVLDGLKHQSGLDTDNWAVVGGATNSDGQHLVILVDEGSLKKLEALGMRPYLGCERITFKVQGPKDPSKKK